MESLNLSDLKNKTKQTNKQKKTRLEVRPWIRASALETNKQKQQMEHSECDHRVSNAQIKKISLC
jgi:hypothetical protein